jgi:hypothetical protein
MREGKEGRRKRKEGGWEGESKEGERREEGRKEGGRKRARILGKGQFEQASRA